MKIYRGPGKYIAVCNNTNFDGHYIKRFEVPVDAGDVEAGWYFLNHLDFGACLEDVYPEDIFASLKEPT